VDIADRHALVPVYSFLTDKDQAYVIEKIHSEKKSSVVVVDEIRQELGNGTGISRHSPPADSRRYSARPDARRGSNWAKRSEAGSQRPESWRKGCRTFDTTKH